MKDGLFKNLILDTYKKWNGGNLVCILYGAVSTTGYKDIKDINGFVENCNPDMLYIKSRLTGNETEVYEYDLENYKIKDSESTIYIKCKNKMERAIMY